MKSRLNIAATILFAVLLLAGCVPDNLKLEVDAGEKIKPEMTKFNENWSDLNKNIASGIIRLDPELQRIVQELKTQIEQFNRSGVIGEDGLLLLNELLKTVERGIEVGLDDATLEMVEGWKPIIDNQPEKWGDTFGTLIKALDILGTDLSDKIRADLETLEHQVAKDMQGMLQENWEQARCTVDYTGQKVDQTVATAGPKFVAGLFPFLREAYANGLTAAQIPGVCVIKPYEMNLIWKDGLQVTGPESQLIHISGFNLSDENLPTVAIYPEDESKPPYELSLTPKRETAYRITINMQGKSFADIEPGATIVIKWSDALPDMVFRKAILIESPCYADANFNASTTRGIAPLEVQFFDQSSCEPTTHFWDFGDGKTSNEENPVHKYDMPGAYSVKLSVDNMHKRSNAEQVDNFISVVAPPVPVVDFTTVDRPEGTVPFTVQFSASAIVKDATVKDSVSWLWEFGDGQKSDKPDPEITFSSPGNWSVRLTVTDRYGQAGMVEKQDFVTVNLPPAPVVGFTSDKRSGQVPLSVQFQGEATGKPVSWQWDFGNGQGSTDRSPNVLFPNTGSFTVRLAATDQYGQQGTAEKVDFIVVNPPPTPTPTPIPTPAFTTYLIRAKTDSRGNAGTDSDVLIRLIGEAGATNWIDLDNPGDDFVRGRNDDYYRSLSTLGNIQYVEVWVNGEDDWYTNGIWVKDTVTSREYDFPCNRWIGNDDGPRVRMWLNGQCGYF